MSTLAGPSTVPRRSSRTTGPPLSRFTKSCSPFRRSFANPIRTTRSWVTSQHN
ncbi:hypothetical protein FFLO_02753 [Filobasidium floriforme]|uniref:Uncharacterized protein n=1 Tax=Filobasidium floriforme TaxID=5210 RepID=A0A8K0JLZ0_9TREE|nr:hypothetical protein FFLO_02753 [Filobasidium floriforme]